MQASIRQVAGAEGIARQDLSTNDLLYPCFSVTDVLLRCCSQDAVVQSLLYQGLTEMLREVAESRAKVAAGVATDNQGYLLQVTSTSTEHNLRPSKAQVSVLCLRRQEWRPFNSRQWLGEYMLARSGTQVAELHDINSTPE